MQDIYRDASSKDPDRRVPRRLINVFSDDSGRADHAIVRIVLSASYWMTASGPVKSG